MGIGSGQAVLLNRLYDYGRSLFVKSVCELGDQIPIKNELNNLFYHYRKNPLKNDFKADELYDYLGYKKYVNIDINGSYKSLKYDLNDNLITEYCFDEEFDVVTNFGTTEHCFNQYQVFRNIHNLCKTNGFMLHTVPAQGWGRHCFFRYDINFFEDLSKTNHYDIIFLKPFIRLKPYIKASKKSIYQIELFTKFLKSEILNIPSHSPYYENETIENILYEIGCGRSLFNITIGCLLQKMESNEFKAPIQKMYK